MQSHARYIATPSNLLAKLGYVKDTVQIIRLLILQLLYNRTPDKSQPRPMYWPNLDTLKRPYRYFVCLSCNCYTIARRYIATPSYVLAKHGYVKETVQLFRLIILQLLYNRTPDTSLPRPIYWPKLVTLMRPYRSFVCISCNCYTIARLMHRNHVLFTGQTWIR